jgi:hypothetical protein
VTKPSRMVLVLLGAVALALSACSGTNPTTTAGSNVSSVRHIYVALGENGSNGSRTRFDLRSLWPQLFYQSALGTSGTFFDFTEPDETLSNLIDQVLPHALAVHPDLVTVWANAADIAAGTTPSTYEGELGGLVRALRKAGATVLVANVAPPELDSAIGACSGNAGGCQTGSTASSTAVVSTYDAAIATVAHATGARLVDLHEILTAAIGTDGLANIVTANEMSLSSKGAALVTKAFRAQLPKAFSTAHRSS